MLLLKYFITLLIILTKYLLAIIVYVTIDISHSVKQYCIVIVTNLLTIIFNVLCTRTYMLHFVDGIMFFAYLNT